MNPTQHLLLIINPVSGTHSKDRIESKLQEALSRHGFDTEAVFTRGHGHAADLAREAVDDKYDGVLVCGGDGTVNEVATVLIDTGMPMGILPAGSGNGLARHLFLPIDPLQAVDVIGRRHIRACDYGKVNGKPFFCTFGVGFDAAVSDRFAAAHARGAITYVRSALQEFANYHPHTYRIVADGEEIDDEAFLVSVCNASQYGNNAYIAPCASITDGMLDLVVVRNIPRFGTVMLGIEMMAGTLAEHHGVVMRKARHIIIERSVTGPAHLDGEPFADMGTRIEIECCPSGLLLFANPDKPPFRPIITPFQAMVSDVGTSIRNLIDEL